MAAQSPWQDAAANGGSPSQRTVGKSAPRLMRAGAAEGLPAYDAVVPLRFAPLHAPERFDERAGLVTRLAPNIARVNAALAVTVPTGQGRRMIERIEVI